jgi:hypothetical protein
MNERDVVEMIVAACAFLLIVGTRYVLAPLRFRRSHYLAGSPEIRPLDAAQRLPPDVEEFFKKEEGALRSCGFEPLGDHAITNLTKRVAGNARLFVNHPKRTLATLLVTYLKTKKEVWQINKKSMVFRTDFADGCSLHTSNVALLHIRPPRPTMHGYRFIRIIDPAALHRVHEAIIERLFERKTRDLVLDSKFDGDHIRFARWQAERERAHLVETGYYYHDKASDTLRLTVKGAFLGAWKRSWPWRQFRDRKRDRDAARVLKQIGMNEYGQPL